MSNKLTLKEIALDKLNRTLNPNFETKFIWTLLVSGIALLGYQRVLQMASSIEVLSHDIYVKLSLSSGTDTLFVLIGCFMVLTSCYLFYLKYQSSNKSKVVTYKSLKKAAKSIRPLLDESRRVFMTFGPNSDVGNSAELRYDIEVWEELKREQIVPNNDKIRSILESVAAFDKSEQVTVLEMKSHIEAFKKHCEVPEFDYSDHQFPIAFADLIFSYCSNGKNNIEEYKSWFRNEVDLESARLENVFLYGSALFGEEKSDVDIIIKTTDTSIELVRGFSEESNHLMAQFLERFGLKLHLKVFSELEVKSYEQFMQKIHSTEKVL